MPSSSSIASLNPSLQQALNCLDLRLEDELLRYRRARAGLSVSPIVLRPKNKKKDIDLMSVEPVVQAKSAEMNTAPKAVSSDLADASLDSAMIPFEAEYGENGLLDLANPTEEATPPDDYLESSEQLLQSLAREEAKVKVERGFLQSLASPLGVGSMLTLLVSSAMFGYVIMNPTSLSGIGRMFAPSKTESAENAPASEEEAIPNSPALDSQEFVDLRLDRLSALKTAPNPVLPIPGASPSPTVSPSASPSPTSQPAAISALGANSTGFAAPSSNSAPANNANRVPAPVRQAAPATQLPPVSVPRTVAPPVDRANSAPSAQTGVYSYKVEVPFTGDRSLEAVRQVVPDAYLRPDGKIQLGAAASPAEAQQKAQALQNRGIAAEVRQR